MALWTILAAAVLGVLFLPLIQLGLGVKPPKPTSSRTPADLDLVYEPVRFRTEDGLELAGWWIPADPPAPTTVIVGHGYPMDKADVLPAVAFLQRRYNLFLFDHRSFGESAGSITTVGLREPLDVRAAVDEALSFEPTEHVAAWGFSLSAATILRAQDDRIEAIVADSGFAELESVVEQAYRVLGPLKRPMAKLTGLYARVLLGLDPREVDVAASLAEGSAPLLIIHGEADGQIPVEHAHRLAEAAGERAELWTIPGAGHGESYAAAPAEYEARILRFLDEHVPGSSDQVGHGQNPAPRKQG